MLLVANSVNKANCSTAMKPNVVKVKICSGMANIRRVIKTIILKSAVAIKITETRKFLDVDDIAQHYFVVRKYNTSIIAISTSCIDSQIR